MPFEDPKKILLTGLSFAGSISWTGPILNSKQSQKEAPLVFSQLFVMGPHPDDLHYFDIFKGLKDEAMLNIYAAGISAREISHEFLIRRGTLEGVSRKDIEQRFGFFPEA